jgi:hypothetical protein
MQMLGVLVELFGDAPGYATSLPFDSGIGVAIIPRLCGGRNGYLCNIYKH